MTKPAPQGEEISEFDEQKFNEVLQSLSAATQLVQPT